MKKLKSLFIAVNPVASKFAKSLQAALREKVVNKIYRVDHQAAARKRAQNKTVFFVTPNTLNKVEQYECFSAQNVSSPKFTRNSELCRQFDCKTLFARTLLNSTSGRGIIEFNSDESEYPEAPLYTEYIPKKSEYRVHTFGGKVIDIQEKRKRRGHEGVRNTRVRNVNNGYVYCRDGLTPPDGIADLAIRATAACGYQYGAVDIIYNEKRNQCYVLEVNTRPGIEGSTVDKYIQALIDKFNLTRK